MERGRLEIGAVDEGEGGGCGGCGEREQGVE